MRGNRRNARLRLSDCAMGVIKDDNGFTLKTFNPKRKFTENVAPRRCRSDPCFSCQREDGVEPKGCTLKQ